MPATRKITEMIFGAPLDPFSKETRRHVVLVAFLAWIGLGADGLSSSCYGPEEAFLALGENPTGFVSSHRYRRNGFHHCGRLQSGDRVVPLGRRRLQGRD